MKKLLSVFILIFVSSCIYAQSADVITKILDSKEATYGEVCYLSAVRQNLISENDDFDKAIEVLAEKKQIPSLVGKDDPIPLANVSFIFLQIWPNVSKSFMYKLTKGSPRYAFKLLKADAILDERSDPSDYVDGSTVLNVLTACMMEYGSEDECMAMDIE